jgi:hypothetical protein
VGNQVAIGVPGPWDGRCRRVDAFRTPSAAQKKTGVAEAWEAGLREKMDRALANACGRTAARRAQQRGATRRHGRLGVPDVPRRPLDGCIARRIDGVSPAIGGRSVPAVRNAKDGKPRV